MERGHPCPLFVQQHQAKFNLPERKLADKDVRAPFC